MLKEQQLRTMTPELTLLHDQHIQSTNPSKLFTSTQSFNNMHHTNSSSLEAINQDLLRCSLAMGVSSSNLEANKRKIMSISKRINHFLKNLHFLIPNEYSPNFRNPCWYFNVSISSGWKRLFSRSHVQYIGSKTVHTAAQNLFEGRHPRRKLICLPYFFIAGFPKSASTSLHVALTNHPHVVPPETKEPHWWTRASNVTMDIVDPDFANLSVYYYLSYFTHVADSLSSLDYHGENFITYDGSQSTLWDSNFFVDDQDYCAMPAVMSRILPNAKFIVIMRNPVTRLYSHYVWSFSNFYGTDTSKWPSSVKRNLTAHFHDLLSVDLSHFKECLKTASLFECVNIHIASRTHYSKNQPDTVTHKISIGLYYIHLKKWLQFYPKSQFLYLRMEDLATNPHQVMSQITDFLGIKSTSKEEVDKLFGMKANKQTTGGVSTAMEERTRTLLEEFYHPYNEMLAELIGDDKFLWSDQVL